MIILDWLLLHQQRIDTKEISSLYEWKNNYWESVSGWNEPIDRAVAGGFLSDRVGYAFAAGYEAALMRLVPSLPERSIVSICITEEKGGHPGMIKSNLQGAPGQNTWVLNGSKKFITLAGVADLFLVAATIGTAQDKKNIIRLVQVERNSPGIEITPMHDLAFVPEISHGVLTFHDVLVNNSCLLPGDGYADYIRPFRTIEDLHVSAAITGYMFRIACLHQWPRSIKELIASLLAGTRSLALEDPASPGVHIALGGLGAQMSSVFESAAEYWEKTDETTRSRWERDRAILGVAEKSRAIRLEKAWMRF
jgi:hypothetical protein